MITENKLVKNIQLLTKLIIVKDTIVKISQVDKYNNNLIQGTADNLAKYKLKEIYDEFNLAPDDYIFNADDEYNKFYVLQKINAVQNYLINGSINKALNAIQNIINRLMQDNFNNK